MPNIKTFDAPQLGLRPTETGVEATAAAARRLRADYTEAGAAIAGVGRQLGSAIADAGDVAVKYIDHQQISHGALALAGLFNAKEDEWNDTVKKADPNDPTVAQKFLSESLEPDLEKFKEGFTTENSQRWAEAHVDQLRQHMYRKTSADMATAAGIAVQENARGTINSLSNTARKDPTSLDFALQTLEGTSAGVAGSSPNLKGTAVLKVQSELNQKGSESIIKSAVLGHIEKTGEVPDWVTDSKYSKYISGTELQVFAKAAQAQQRANALTQKQLEQYQHTQDVRAANADFSRVWTDNVSFDENGKATIKPQVFQQLMDVEQRYPGVATPRAEAMINFARSQQRERREVINSDPAVKASLYDGMFRTDNPTTDVDILKASAQDKLNAHDTSILMNLHKSLEERPLKGPLYQGTMDAAKGILGVNVVPDGHERYANFLQTFLPAYLALPQPDRLKALDTRDPSSLISQAMKPYTPTDQQRLMGRVLRNLGGVQPAELGVPEPSQAQPKREAVPPASRRETNKTYQTPVGPRKWTGTGWVEP